MNARLESALRSAARRLGEAQGLSWSDALLVQNYAGVPTRAPAGEHSRTRGFNLVLLDRAGTPAHYAKCRISVDGRASRETTVLENLAADESVGPHLMRVASGADGALTVQLARYRGGRLFAHVIPGMSQRRWSAAVEELLAIAGEASRVAMARMPQLFPGGRRDMARIAAPALTRLGRNGVSARGLEVLASALREGGEVEAVVQHGDLWPPNILRTPSGWLLLDFEHFGEVDVPLFDACHLIHTTVDYKISDGAGVPGTWARHLTSSTAPAAEERRLLGGASRRSGLAPSQALAALVFYHVVMADRPIAMGQTADHWLPLVGGVRAVSELLRDGALSPSLFTGAS